MAFVHPANEHDKWGGQALPGWGETDGWGKITSTPLR